MENYEAPKQSPLWDCHLSLEEYFKQAMFFVLLKRQSHGSLAYIILSEFIRPNEMKCYNVISLNHDQYGVECDADGTFKASLIDEFIKEGIGEITSDKDVVLRHIWEVMNCHPNVEKLFTEYKS